MWQKILLQSKKNSPARGFLTMEIIIATIVAFGFLMFSLQAIAFAMMMKIQAQKEQRADQLIQEDIERIGGLSSALNLNMATNCNADTYANGYAQELWNDLLDDDADNLANGIDNLTTPLMTDGAGGIILTLARTHVDDISEPPHRTLRIFYQVTSNDNLTEINASRYVEIIPEEALQCP